MVERNSGIQDSVLRKLTIMQLIKLKAVARKMMTFIRSRQYSQLEQKHFRLICDVSSDKTSAIASADSTGQDRLRSLMQKSPLTNQIRKAIEAVPVFLPSNKFKIAWDAISFLNTLACIYFILLEIATGLRREQIMSPAVKSLLEWTIVADIVFELNSGYYLNGRVINDRFQVSLSYISRDMAYDVLLYLAYRFGDLLSPWLMLIFLVKLAKLNAQFQRIPEIINLSLKAFNYLELVKLFLFIVFTAHVFACVWLYEARNSAYDSTWMSPKNLQHERWIIQVLSA